MDIEKTGRLIAKKRISMGLTQEQLSSRLHVTPQAISLWETGQRYPGPDAQVMLFSVLGLNPVELLVGVEMFDKNLKAEIAKYLPRIDEKALLSGVAIDEDGNEISFDWSEYSIVTTIWPDHELSDEWVPYKEYYNID